MGGIQQTYNPNQSIIKALQVQIIIKNVLQSQRLYTHMEIYESDKWTTE